jgi:pSer/pThr/pTyr-binding forkhead associated (FHA) protein
MPQPPRRTAWEEGDTGLDEPPQGCRLTPPEVLRVADNVRMPQGPFSPHSSSPRELKEQIAAERAQTPFLVYRDADDEQQILTLEASEVRLRVGRDPMCDLCLAHDDRVSRLHAELENVGDVWTLADHGLSRNGTFVNEERVTGQRVLHDGDVLRIGGTHLLFRSPADSAARPTRAATGGAPPQLSDVQRRILIALCRPYREGTAFATPASNREIATEVFLSVDRVKAQLGNLFDLLGVDEERQTHKRARLAETALRTGLVTRRELGEP